MKDTYYTTLENSTSLRPKTFYEKDEDNFSSYHIKEVRPKN